MLLGLAACSSGPAPSSPAKEAPKERKDQDDDDDDDDDDDKDDDKDDDDDADDDADTGDESSTDTSTETADKPQEPTSFVRVGADIGDDETKEAVKTCLDSGKVFDRFATEVGECTKVSLAKVDCTLDGIRAILTTNQKSQFETALAGPYQGWLLDQCGDCSKGSGAVVCKSSEGAEQVGTKLYFVKEDADQIKGKAMVLPVRPWQTTDTSTSTSSSTSTSTSSSTSSSTSTSTSSSTSTGT
jgi:hypothetical protein